MDLNNEEEMIEYSCMAELLSDMKRDRIRDSLINEEEETTSKKSRFPINLEDTASKKLLCIKEFKEAEQWQRISPIVPLAIFDKETRNWVQIKDQIGFSSTGVIPVHMAAYIPQESQSLPINKDIYFSVKFIYITSEAFRNLKNEAQRNRLIRDHENVLGIEDAFFYREYFCVVFPLMNRGSIRSLMNSNYRDGLPENFIVAALRETLKGLCFIHGNGLVHREISAGHVFLNFRGDFKLAYSGTIYEVLEDLGVPSSSTTLPSISISDWGAAPEVYNLRKKDYTKKADIWLFGVLALELVYGSGFKFGNRSAFESMVRKINQTKKLPKKEKEETTTSTNTSNSQELKSKEKLLFTVKGLLKGILPVFKERAFSKEFEKMVVRCLAMAPEARPSADELLKSGIFGKSKGVAYLQNL